MASARGELRAMAGVVLVTGEVFEWRGIASGYVGGVVVVAAKPPPSPASGFWWPGLVPGGGQARRGQRDDGRALRTVGLWLAGAL